MIAKEPTHKTKVLKGAKLVKKYHYGLHAEKRVRERFGMELGDRDRKEIIALIEKNKGKIFVAKAKKPRRKYWQL
jgi:hypothetical protein